MPVSNKPDYGSLLIKEEAGRLPFLQFLDALVELANTNEEGLVAAAEALQAHLEDKYAHRPALINWRGTWQGAALGAVNEAYLQYDQVFDEGWLMIANKDTSEKAAPQPTGPLTFVSELVGTLTFATPTIVAGLYATGNRFTFTSSGYIGGYRWYVPEISGNFTYEVWSAEVGPAGAIVRQLVAPVSPSSVGWINIAATGLVLSGTIIDLAVVVRSVVQPNIFNAPWETINGNVLAPEVGQAIFRNDAVEIRVHHIDGNGTNQRTTLEAVTTGGTLSFGGETWTIISTEPQANSINYGVAPNLGRPNADVYNLLFQWGASDPVPYVVDAAFYNGIATVTGFQDTKYPPDAQNDNGYGVDILVQDALVSEDWDLAAFSSGG